MTVDFAEVYVGVVDIADAFTHSAGSTSAVRLKAARDRMVPAMARIDAKLRSRKSVRFSGDTAWYQSRFEP